MHFFATMGVSCTKPEVVATTTKFENQVDKYSIGPKVKVDKLVSNLLLDNWSI